RPPRARFDIDVLGRSGSAPDESYGIRVDERKAVNVPRNRSDDLRHLRPFLWVPGADQARNIHRRCGTRRSRSPTGAHSDGTKCRDYSCSDSQIGPLPAGTRPKNRTRCPPSAFEEALNGARILGPIGWIVGEAPRTEGQHCSFDQGRSRCRRNLRYARDTSRRALLGTLAEEDLVQNDTKRPDVGTGGRWVTFAN